MFWKVIAFVVVTAILVLVSRSSLRNPRSHGFSRFFAWEAITGLLLLNVERWFVHPFAWNQIISWALLIASLVPVVWGTIMLRRHGAPVKQRESDPALLAFEKTTQLVSTGIFGSIRHPLYCSLLLLAWGIFFKSPSVFGGGLAVVATVFLFLTALADEAECRRFFGTEYDAYMRKTKRFVPFLI